MSGLPPKVPIPKKDVKASASKESKSKEGSVDKVEKLDDEKSMLAVGTLMNQALSYMIDNGMVELPDELRTLNVINREKVVHRIDEEGLEDDVFKEIGKISEDMRREGEKDLDKLK
jgi:hypothetical protein